MKKIRKDNVVLRVADEELNAYLQKGFKEVKPKSKLELNDDGDKNPKKENKEGK